MVLGEHYRLGPQRAVCLHCQQESRVQLRRHDLPDCDQRRRQLLHLARRVTAGGHGDFVHRPHLNARFAADCEADRPGRRHRAQLRYCFSN